jgi:bifunctional DNA-binding transcriptional regulator/antitoxin component of YhaV-PrlF toxin-antitoxin module
MTGSSRYTLRVAKRGVITLPKALRQAYKLDAGNLLSLIDLGGVFVLSPHRSEIDHLADHIVGNLAERGESLESMLSVIRAAREQ